MFTPYSDQSSKNDSGTSLLDQTGGSLETDDGLVLKVNREFETTETSLSPDIFEEAYTPTPKPSPSSSRSRFTSVLSLQSVSLPERMSSNGFESDSKIISQLRKENGEMKAEVEKLRQAAEDQKQVYQTISKENEALKAELARLQQVVEEKEDEVCDLPQIEKIYSQKREERELRWRKVLRTLENVRVSEQSLPSSLQAGKSEEKNEIVSPQNDEKDRVSLQEDEKKESDQNLRRDVPASRKVMLTEQFSLSLPQGKPSDKPSAIESSLFQDERQEICDAYHVLQEEINRNKKIISFAKNCFFSSAASELEKMNNLKRTKRDFLRSLYKEFKKPENGSLPANEILMKVVNKLEPGKIDKIIQAKKTAGRTLALMKKLGYEPPVREVEETESKSWRLFSSCMSK